ncbi:uncharacterized protein LOC123661270 [Melitaea cinxia]|uniref:uncharacterized protein LOC123661270 n=1 Tax=Melitaea cinxia TaxID=113334 RepID=UPI001E270D88|nr:uncharacterized protein LOC123661270 [Melitaea cinxia]
MLASQYLYVFKKNEMRAEFLDIVSAMANIFIVTQGTYLLKSYYIKMTIVAYKRGQIKALIMEIGKIWPTEIDNEEKERTLNSWTRRLKLFDDGIAVHMCVYVSCDFLLVDLTFDLSALFSLLRLDLENVVKSDSENYNILNDDCEDIKFIVKKHQKLLSLSETLNQIFEVSLFSHVTTSSVIICCNVFMAVKSEGFFLRYFTGALSLMFAIFVITWPGQMLCDTLDLETRRLGAGSDDMLRLTVVLDAVAGAGSRLRAEADRRHLSGWSGLTLKSGGLSSSFVVDAGLTFAFMFQSYNVGVAAYQCAWYQKGKKFRKCIAIIIARSQKECYLSALGFSYLTLAMFSKIITTAWSYVSLLNRMYEDTGL